MQFFIRKQPGKKRQVAQTQPLKLRFMPYLFHFLPINSYLCNKIVTIKGLTGF